MLRRRPHLLRHTRAQPDTRKGARTRELEDAVVSRVALAALAHACGVGSAPKPEDAAGFWCLPSNDEECSLEFGESVGDEQLQVSFRPPD